MTTSTVQEPPNQALSDLPANVQSRIYSFIPNAEAIDTQIIQDRLRAIGEHVVQEIYLDDDNTEEVEHFNYKQELKKKFSVSSIIGLGFSLMNVPFGMATTLSIGLVCGSSFTILWGWILFSIFTVFISLSLSEISSKFPSSGGVYHFSSILANEKYSLVSSWFTGWYLIIGNWLMFISCAFGGAQFILSIFGLKESDYKHDDWLILVLFFIIVALCAIVNLKFQKHLESINKLCLYWTIYTVLIMDFLLLIFSNSFHDLKYVLTHFDASRSGWPSPIAFLIGGIQFSSMTYNGYGIIAAMSEEVDRPEKTIPKGMVYSVLMSALTGLMFILPILAVLPDLNQILDDNPDIFPIDLVFKLSTKSFIVSFFLVILIVGSVGFATIGSLTTASRTVYAFGRDHGLPFDYLWQTVDTTEDQEMVPKNALLLSVGVSCLLGSLSLISSSAFNAFLGCSVVSLNISYGIPILSSLLNKRRKIRGAAFKLRKFGYIVNILSCLCILLTMIVLCMPASRYINIKTMNYAIVVFVLFTLLIAVSYYFWGRYHFQGPLIDHANAVEARVQEFQATGSSGVSDVPMDELDPFTLIDEENEGIQSIKQGKVNSSDIDAEEDDDDDNFAIDEDSVFVRHSDIPDDDSATLFDVTSSRARERSNSLDFTEIRVSGNGKRDIP